MKLRHEVTYQGYKASAVLYRRSQGLNPEPGYVELDMKDVKTLKVHARDVPWRPAGGQEIHGQIDIKTYFTLFSNQTVTETRPLPEPKGGGLNPFGDLVLSSYDEKGGQLVDEHRYTDVYVDLGGVEAAGQDLAEIETKPVGKARVPLTDIRKWYKCGSLVCAINRRLKSGNWDPGTTKDGKSDPWTLREVLQFLLSQLPGSPSMVSYSDPIEKAGQFDPPTNVVGEGEPAAEHLQKLLDHFGLVAGLLPTNHYVITRKHARRYQYKEAPGKFGKKLEVPKGGSGLHYERRSSTQTDRPPAVAVLGKRRIRRGTFNYIPVLPWIDGRHYPMQAVLDMMGYSKFSLDAQVFSRSDKKFRDVGPDPGRLTGGNDGQRHEKHRKILMQAYRVYAPAFLFPESGGSLSAMPDLQANPHPYLPVKECPWYVRELGGQEIPSDTLRESGDQDEYVLLKPVVRGCRVGRQFFTDFGTVEKYFQGQVAGVNKAAAAMRQLLKLKEDELKAIGERLVTADDIAQATFRTDEARNKWKADNAAKFIDINRDSAMAAAALGFGEVFSKKLVSQAMGTGVLLNFEIASLLRSITYLKQVVGRFDDKIGGWKNQFEVFKRVYERRGGVELTYNIPMGVLEDVSVDPETGLLKSQEPLCHVDKPMFPDGDSAKVVSDGEVTVTYGYELKENNIAARTAFLFAPDSQDDRAIPNAVFAGVCSSSPLKAVSVPMNSRMYLLDLSTPVNFTACLTEARSKAAPLLEIPRQVEGYTYEIDGFRAYWLDGGVSSIQHTWEGARTPAYTVLAVGSSGGSLPAGPAFVTERKATPNVDRAEAADRERAD